MSLVKWVAVVANGSSSTLSRNVEMLPVLKGTTKGEGSVLRLKICGHVILEPISSNRVMTWEKAGSSRL
jgi:hypothetical protein